MRVSRSPAPAFACGDHVFDPVDPRHIGRVERTVGHTVHLQVLVRWANGWLSDIVYRPGARTNLKRVQQTQWVPGHGHIRTVNH
jgi:hypothetical protein